MTQCDFSWNLKWKQLSPLSISKWFHCWNHCHRDNRIVSAFLRLATNNNKDNVRLFIYLDYNGDLKAEEDAKEVKNLYLITFHAVYNIRGLVPLHLTHSTSSQYLGHGHWLKYENEDHPTDSPQWTKEVVHLQNVASVKTSCLICFYLKPPRPHTSLLPAVTV